jgi:hypothetical protein
VNFVAHFVGHFVEPLSKHHACRWYSVYLASSGRGRRLR